MLESTARAHRLYLVGASYAKVLMFVLYFINGHYLQS